MDKATIEAMRVVVEAVDRAADWAARNRKPTVELNGGLYPLDEFFLAAKGLRTLFDQAAAEQPEIQAEPDARALLTQFTEDLEDAVLSAQKDDEPRVSIATPRYWKSRSLAEVNAVIRAINGMMEAKIPNEAKPSPESAEPTAEECLAAINRANHRRSRWDIFIRDNNGLHWLNHDEFTGLGRLLIERERGEAV